MRLDHVRGKVAARLVAVALAATAVACGGSGGNNDQGIVFTATGLWRAVEQIDERITCTVPLSTDNALPDTSFTLSLSGVQAFPDRSSPIGDPCGGWIGLQNNLTSLNINVQQILVRYEVPGASIQVPDNPVSFGLTLPSTSSDTNPASGQPGLVYAQLVGQIVPAPIMVFLNQNVDRLPATPYFMNVFITASGQSQTGDNYTTNEIGYQLTIVP
jgi:hypothetical protein